MGILVPLRDLGQNILTIALRKLSLLQELRLPFESEQLDVLRENALTHSSALKDKRELFYLQN